jgi:hypothetical protein
MAIAPDALTAALGAQLQRPLALLLRAYDYAQALRRGTWDLAVEIGSLQAAGLTNSDLRWLLYQGLAEHAAEAASRRKNCRAFHGRGQFPFKAGTCVVLTEEGARFARDACQSVAANQVQETSAHQAVLDRTTWTIPCWNNHARELRFGTWLVKKFKVPACNQQLVLSGLQELGWPWHFDDPLPPVEDLDPRRRLHDTINRLNRHQVHPLIHFRGDGSGRGLHWEPILGTATRLPPERL